MPRHLSPGALRRGGDGRPMTLATVRRVWAAVTAAPQASLRELSAATGLCYGACGDALRLLRDAGYVTFADGTQRARVVVVGLYER